MKDVYVNGKRTRYDPSRSIGKGGEADVYEIDGNLALKLFKPSSHPDLVGQPEEQAKARARIAEHQNKLPAFPDELPERVIVPKDVATTRGGKKIVGYTMAHLRGAEELFSFAQKAFREGVIPAADVVKIFQSLYGTVDALHQKQVIIGDFNDLNVLVKDLVAHLIDSDSFQFGSFLSHAYTQDFLDPLLAKPDPASGKSSPVLTRPYVADSDWYAFAVMLMRCLLYVGPYGGVYRPKDKSKRMPEPARALHRITVFDSEVRYPKPAIPYGVLPDDLLHHFHQLFIKDERGQFPQRLINSLHFTECSQCGTEHARGVCPVCNEVAPARVVETTVVRGQVTATRFFVTRGQILHSTVQDGQLRFLYHEDGQFKREDKSSVGPGKLDPRMRYRLQKQTTLLGKTSRMIDFTPGKAPEVTTVDNYGPLPIFDSNSSHRYFVANGQLKRDGRFGPEHIGDVLKGQTVFWVGPKFGFGFYRAGELTVSFVFDAKRAGINDKVKLPPFSGQVVDATCAFSDKACWFFLSLKQGGQIINRCYLIRPDGSVTASAEALVGDDSWLGTVRGKCAAGHFLLAATDEGIVRVEADGDRLVQTKAFPDTEPFVDSSVALHVGHHGLYVVGRREIRILKIR